MYRDCTLEELIALSNAIHHTLTIAEPVVHRWFELPLWYDDLQIERACLDERIRFMQHTTRPDLDDTQPLPIIRLVSPDSPPRYGVEKGSEGEV